MTPLFGEMLRQRVLGNWFPGLTNIVEGERSKGDDKFSVLAVNSVGKTLLLKHARITAAGVPAPPQPPISYSSHFPLHFPLCPVCISALGPQSGPQKMVLGWLLLLKWLANIRKLNTDRRQ
jgi:hypothetical protein